MSIYLALQLVGKDAFQRARLVFSTGWQQIVGCAAVLLALAFPRTGWAQPSLCGVWMPQTAANWDFSVLVRPDGKLYAWGDNTYGQLGIGAASAPHLAPVAVASGAIPTGTRFVQVSAGSYHTVALAANGRLFAWGSNARFGQLGNGSDVSSAAPVAVVLGAAPAGTRFVQVSAAAFHTVALAADGTLYAWGNNELGELGDSTFIDRFAPVAVRLSPKLAGTRFTQVATGLNQTVAIAADGALYAWRNGPTHSATPKAVPLGAAPAGTRFIQVSTGGDYALALAADGRVYAWGNNVNGQLGNGATLVDPLEYVFVSSPVAVAAPAGVRFTQVSAGSVHALALARDGSLYAWGARINRPPGKEDASNCVIPTAVQVGAAPAGTHFVHISAGGGHCLAIANDGTVYAWGLNKFGQLGDNSTTQRFAPVVITVP